MTNSPLEQIIAAGESSRVEFKATAPETDTIGQIVCSFLNSQGGTLILGVDDDRRVVGVDNADQKAEAIRSDLLNSISPVAAWSINVDLVGGKSLIVVDVPQGAEGPYVFKNSIFVRRQSRTFPATSAEINYLINRRHSEGSRWERLPALGFDLEDLDVAEVQRTAEEAEKRRLYKFSSADDPLATLEQLSLAERGLVLNSAVVLFGQHPANRFPQMRIRAARFRGIDSLTGFSDNRVFEGHAFGMIESVEQFLRAHIPIESELPVQGVTRTDNPAYPWLALREAVLNAIVHRDYAAFDGGMSVAIYDDRIEVWNSGGLPAGMTVDNLKGPHPSRPHNPDIANVFFLRGFIERWGMGTRQIVSRCLNAGLPEPEWRTDGGGLTLIIRLKPKAVASRLNPRQVRLLRRLKTGGQILPKDYFSLVAKEAKERRARQDLVELFEAAYLSRVGRGPATVYVRTDKPLP